MRIAAVVALLGLVVAGSACVDRDTRNFSLGGTFTKEATQTDLDDFDARMKAHGADDVLVMESFPMQFRATPFYLGACVAARSEAMNLTYVDAVGQCQEIP